MNFENYKVVHCTTLEEWKIVNSLINEKFRLGDNYWEENKENTCKVLDRAQYSQISFFEKFKATIYSFKEWYLLSNTNMEYEEENYDYLIKFLNDLEIK